MIALTAIFAALNAAFDSFPGLPQLVSGVWYSWIFMMEPLTGLILSPYTAFLATLVGVIVGHSIYPRGEYELLFTLGAPIGSLISGLMLRDRRKIVTLYFTLLLSAYFLTPVARDLPIWGMWDTYIAFATLLIYNLLNLKRRRKGSGIANFAFCAFIGLEADILFRIFLFIPCQTYRFLFAFTVETLKVIWAAGAVVTPVQVVLSSLFTSVIAPQIQKILKSTRLS